MIAIDTNVLLRYLLADDEQQYSKARNLITSHPPVLITDVVLVETIWIIDSNRG
ncbi:MAG: PIN domain-containing protein, partial [Nitrosomonas sp.]|nr:PIN domain-containing protein [Nitrosomonas sp.]